MHRHPTGSVGCTIGLAPHIFVGAFDQDAAGALTKAAALASTVNGIMREHPELAAVLPPQATAAFKAISLASKALKGGVSLRDVARTVGPNTARAVGKILSIL